MFTNYSNFDNVVNLCIQSEKGALLYKNNYKHPSIYGPLFAYLSILFPSAMQRFLIIISHVLQSF
jgi:hypothetical protein